MHLTPQFEITDLDGAFDVVDERAAGTLVVAGPEGLDATFLPWILDRGPLGAAVLRGHVAKANPIASTVSRGPVTALAVFDLTDGYVSPSWYPSKVEHQRVVPTWNYVSVHLYGEASAVHDREWLMQLVDVLTERHEAGSEDPWHVTDAPPDFVEKQLEAVVGIRLRIDRVEAKAKLSQNRPAADIEGVMAGLEHRPGADALLGEMRRRVEQP